MDQKVPKAWLGAIVASTVGFVWSHAFLPWLIFVGSPLVTVLIGYTSGVPWFYVWLGSLAALAFVATAVLRCDEWLQRRRIEGRVAFGAIRIGRNIRGPGMFIGVQLVNRASIPVDVERFDTHKPQWPHAD